MRTEYHSPASLPVQWVVANTHPHKESLATEHLQRQDFRIYCPQVRKRLQKAHRFRDVLRPLFPGYVFVQVAADRLTWRPILSTYGVRSLIRFGNALATLDDEFIRTLKCREVDGVVVRPPTAFKVGDRVSLSGGPFDGLIATILSLDDKDRLVVLMSLLNQSVKVRVDARQVSAVLKA